MEEEKQPEPKPIENIVVIPPEVQPLFSDIEANREFIDMIMADIVNFDIFLNELTEQINFSFCEPLIGEFIKESELEKRIKIPGNGLRGSTHWIDIFDQDTGDALRYCEGVLMSKERVKVIEEHTLYLKLIYDGWVGEPSKTAQMIRENTQTKQRDYVEIKHDGDNQETSRSIQTYQPSSDLREYKKISVQREAGQEIERSIKFGRQVNYVPLAELLFERSIDASQEHAAIGKMVLEELGSNGGLEQSFNCEVKA